MTPKYIAKTREQFVSKHGTYPFACDYCYKHNSNRNKKGTYHMAREGYNQLIYIFCGEACMNLFLMTRV